MSAAINMHINGLLPFKKQMQLLAMPTALRRRLLYRVAKLVIRDSKKRVRQQRDLNGRPFTARAKKRKGGNKMLSKLVKQLKVMNNNSVKAEVSFGSAVAGRIASKHQYGSIETVTARSLNKKSLAASKDSQATRKQARALRVAGFEIKKASGKGSKKPSLKWIVENLKVGQAGAILRALRIEAGEQIKKSWTTVLPARSFLGATAAEVQQHIEMIFKQMKQEIQRGVR